jgi:hypothetical protein
MTDVRDLLKKMAAREAAFAETRFVAPCVRGGKVRARVGGIVQTFATEPATFEGWGVFQARDGKAAVVEEADLPLVAGYLARFPLLRVRLARQLNGQTWLAYPASESDMKQRFGTAHPLALYLVTEGAAFEMVTARNVGGAWWFEDVDRRADPVPTDLLRDALNATTEPEAVQFKGLTPEMRTTYDLATQADARFAARRREIDAREREEQRRRAEEQYRRDHGYEWYVEAHRDEYDAAWAEADADAQAELAENPLPERRGGHRNRRGRNADRNAGNPAHRGGGDETRLREALQTGGGQMRDFRDRGEYWLVEWTTADGHRHTSAIAKVDMTVISSGICLSGRDRDFDLQSLVGVIEARDW